jgi:hypothetical protein
MQMFYIVIPTCGLWFTICMAMDVLFSLGNLKEFGGLLRMIFLVNLQK